MLQESNKGYGEEYNKTQNVRLENDLSRRT